MKREYRQSIAVVILIVILMLLGVATGELAKRTTVDSIPNPNAITSTTTVQTISYPGEEGKTVLELLEKNHKVDSIDSSFGKYVRAIDGVETKTEGDNTGAWIYYVDGTMGESAADKTVTQTGQTIEWRYELF